MRKTAKDAARPVGTLARRWEDLHTTASQLAKLAGLAPEPHSPDLAAFPRLLDEASDWQRDLAWQGIEDISAMMQPGLTALSTLTARGQDASAPAMALWREFHAARASVLAAVQPHEVEHPVGAL